MAKNNTEIRMNTFGYIKLIVRDECRAIREELMASKGLAILFLAIVIGLIIYLNPFPNRHIYFATYYPSSDWSQMAESSASILNKTGLDIKVIYTDGAVDNVALLNDPKNEANAGFTYGLALNKEEASEIFSLGSVAYEPVWILYNKERTGEVADFQTLAKYRVGLGPVKSGSYHLAKKIFDVVNIDIGNRAHFLPDTIINNGAKLKAGEIDAVVFVSTNLDAVTQDLIQSPNIGIFNFKNASAYAKQFNAFVTLTLPADSIDIVRHVPKQDISMLATTTSLVVKKDMHPDLQLALLMGVKDLNRNSPNLFFAKRNEFPSYVDPSIPISPVAERFYDYGPPHAMRYLPYWLAGFVDRAWLLLLTILAIFYPIVKLNVHFRRFRFTLKEYPHYKELLQIEKQLCGQKISTEERVELLERLEKINAHAINHGVPVSEEVAYFKFLNAVYLLKKKIENA